MDARFSFVFNSVPIRAQFVVVQPERELNWTGVSLWFRAVDQHDIEGVAERIRVTAYPGAEVSARENIILPPTEQEILDFFTSGRQTS